MRGVAVLENVQVRFQFSIHFVSSLPPKIHLTVLGKKHTRIVCRPARQAAETVIDHSYSLQLRLKLNESTVIKNW